MTGVSVKLMEIESLGTKVGGSHILLLISRTVDKRSDPGHQHMGPDQKKKSLSEISQIYRF